MDLGNMNVCYLLMSNNERRLALVEKDNERRRANAAALKRIEEEYEKLLEWKAELLKAVQKTYTSTAQIQSSSCLFAGPQDMTCKRARLVSAPKAFTKGILK